MTTRASKPGNAPGSDLGARSAPLPAAQGEIGQARQGDGEREEDVLLTTIARGANAEMRVALSSYKGHRFIGLRQWNRDGDGSWRPDPRRGCTIKLRELDEMRAALARAADLLGGMETEPTVGRAG